MSTLPEFVSFSPAYVSIGRPDQGASGDAAPAVNLFAPSPELAQLGPAYVG